MDSLLSPLLEVFGQLAFVGAVLGGFAMALLTGLLPAASARRVAAWTAGSALLAASSFIVCTVVAVMVVITIAGDIDLNQALGQNTRAVVPDNVKQAYFWCAYAFVFGTVAFLVALGLSGWMRSQAMGLVSSTIAALALVLLVYLTSVVGF